MIEDYFQNKDTIMTVDLLYRNIRELQGAVFKMFLVIIKRLLEFSIR